MTSGDPLLTPDRRRWRILRVDPVLFLAQDLDGKRVLSAALDRLEWSDDDQSWVLLERRRAMR